MLIAIFNQLNVRDARESRVTCLLVLTLFRKMSFAFANKNPRRVVRVDRSYPYLLNKIGSREFLANKSNLVFPDFMFKKFGAW